MVVNDFAVYTAESVIYDLRRKAVKRATKYVGASFIIFVLEPPSAYCATEIATNFKLLRWRKGAGRYWSPCDPREGGMSLTCARRSIGQSIGSRRPREQPAHAFCGVSTRDSVRYPLSEMFWLATMFMILMFINCVFCFLGEP